MNHAVFVYGTLMFPALYECVTGRPLVAETACLPGYRRLSVSNTQRGSFPAIRPESGHSVEGLLIADCSASTLSVLDAFENTSQGLYQRISVLVFDRTKRATIAQTYVAGPALAGRLTDDWCPQQFEVQHLDHYVTWLKGQTPQ